MIAIAISVLLGFTAHGQREMDRGGDAACPTSEELFKASEHTQRFSYTLGSCTREGPAAEVFGRLSADLAARGLLDPARPLPRSPTADEPELYTLQDLCLDTYARAPSAELVDLSYRA